MYRNRKYGVIGCFYISIGVGQTVKTRMGTDICCDSNPAPLPIELIDVSVRYTGGTPVILGNVGRRRRAIATSVPSTAVSPERRRPGTAPVPCTSLVNPCEQSLVTMS